jgi:hypothetical protein
MSDSDPKANGDADPATLIPPEVARANLLHWWREPVAGCVALAAGLWDTWHYGRDAGLSINIDEILVLGGVVLIAGSRRLFISQPLPPSDKGPGP